MTMTWNKMVALEMVRDGQDDEYVLRLESPGFASGLVWGHEKRRVKDDMISFFSQAPGQMELAFTEIEDTGKRIDLVVLVSMDEGVWFWKLKEFGFGNC